MNDNGATPAMAMPPRPVDGEPFSSLTASAKSRVSTMRLRLISMSSPNST